MLRNNQYRGVYVDPAWKLTSQNPGQGHSKFHQKQAHASLERVMAYENKDVVARISHDLHVSLGRAKEIFDDVKRFLYMAAKKSEEINGAIPTPTVDEGWHAFILFTEDYAAFCQTHFGTFLHHVPHREGDKEYSRDILLPSINAMYDIFGGLPSDNWHFGPVHPVPMVA